MWYVDDLPSNLQKFRERHSGVFDIRTFSRPTEVLQALTDSTPDALLCGIFFYENGAVAEEMEKKVQQKANELRTFGEGIGANRPQAGVGLIQQVAAQYRTRFPIYAYTSKGPYLQHKNAFEEIAETGAKWLFKGRYGPSTEQLICRKTSRSLEHETLL